MKEARMRAVIGIGLALVIMGPVVQAAPVGPLSLYLVEPCRFLDTRDAGVRISGDVAFVVRQACGVPADASGVVVNVTVLDATAPGHVVLWDGVTRPATSIINYAPGTVPASNEVTVRLKDLAGSFPVPPIPDLTVTTAAPVHVLLDVTGYLK